MSAVAKTTKSHKSVLRDKPKHSLNGASKNPKRDGAGGKGSWGKPLDELRADFKQGALDSGDPNFVALENDREMVWSPRAAPRRRFAASLSDLNAFKAEIREAALLYLDTGSLEDFQATLLRLDQPVYLQEVPYVLLKLGLHEGPEQLTGLLKLLHALHDAALLSSHQMSQGFRKLSNTLPDLLIDVPRASIMFEEAISHATISGYLELRDGDEIRRRAAHLKDNQELVQFTKNLITEFVDEYFESADRAELAQATAELKASWLHFEVVKQLISKSMDRNGGARELASLALAELSGRTVDTEDVEHAFAVLLERVEDLSLDVPKVLELLSCFLARAIVDEAVPPAFLARVDLVDRDMGSQVLQQTQRLLAQAGAADLLAECWTQNLANLQHVLKGLSLGSGSDSEAEFAGRKRRTKSLMESDDEDDVAEENGGAAAEEDQRRRPLVPPVLSPEQLEAQARAQARAGPWGGADGQSFAKIAREAESRSRRASELSAGGEGGVENGRGSRNVSELQA